MQTWLPTLWRFYWTLFVLPYFLEFLLLPPSPWFGNCFQAQIKGKLFHGELRFMRETMFWNWLMQSMLCNFFWLVHHPWSSPAILIWTRCWCFCLSRQLLVSTLPGKFSSLPAMLPCMTLTCLSFHNLESDSPTSSTTERETIVHGVILSVCWCAQLPLRFAAFLLSFSWIKHEIKPANMGISSSGDHYGWNLFGS